MKTLILKKETWRCGGDGIYRNGEGETALRNDQGFMCCLGQFSIQMDPDVSEQDIIDVGEPFELSNSFGLEDLVHDGMNSELSVNAININDDENTTMDEKIILLQELFLGYNYQIEVI